MIVLVLIGGLLLVIGMVVREFQLARERAARAKLFEYLSRALDANREQLKRLSEDLYVLRTLLAERQIIASKDLIDGRTRLIDGPRRQAEERDAILRGFDILPIQLLAEDPESKMH